MLMWTIIAIDIGVFMRTVQMTLEEELVNVVVKHLPSNKYRTGGYNWARLM